MKNNFNPDVLSCIANLSNDEVFTPPALAKAILDMLPKELWSNPGARFLDPVSKTGVFLREITKRLMAGLADIYPDTQQRADHILQNQVFGIAITELTALLSRRTLYCSKSANGKYAISAFGTVAGNILHEAMQHTWVDGKCSFCGASQAVYTRTDDLESYAYNFIHTDNPESFFPDMKFDVIIGNPPYQMSDGGYGKSASPLYHRFVQQAKRLNPRYLSMIIPSRWFAGGKGLDDFRSEMLNDKRLRKIVEYENPNEVFPGVDLAGGICYFLWERDYNGNCIVVNVLNANEYSSERVLNEFSTFIRHGRAIPIIRKVLSRGFLSMSTQVSSRKPFGLSTTVRPLNRGDINLIWQKGEGPYDSSLITIGNEMINEWKVITSYVGYDHAGNPGKDGKRKVFSKIEILPPGTICTETYLVIGSYTTEAEARNLVFYMKTIFFRFLVSQFMYSHHITKDAYAFVPVLDMKKKWTEKKLAQNFGLTEEEAAFMASVIRPFENES